MKDLQKLFLNEKSFEQYTDRLVLQTLFSTIGVRGDITAMIANLFDFFGSFKGILEARPEQLLKVSHVTEKAASIIAMIVPLTRVWERCNMKDPGSLTNLSDVKAYCKSLLMGERTERFYVICVNARCRILGTRKISEGSLSDGIVYPRLVMETALNYNAHAVFLCHNHPGGTCSASPDDINCTLLLQQTLSQIGITVLDHLIVAGTNVYSMRQNCDIGACAFYSCKSLTSISIPDSVTTIGIQAFYGFDNLTLTVSRDSYTAQYCKDNNLNYTYSDSLDLAEQLTACASSGRPEKL